ncbi:MAG: tetratricopeptide repeat protein [Armatimonadota bacterium]
MRADCTRRSLDMGLRAAGHNVAALAAALGLVVAGLGCSSKDERLYRRAETLFNERSYRLAAEAYREAADQGPGSAFGDNALYKLAFIQREYLEDAEGAIGTYRRLAQEYPDSAFADDALMKVGAIYVRQGDAARAVSAYQEVISQFEKRPRVCARAQLAIAGLLYSQSKPEAIEAARVVLRKYGQSERECAQAQLLLARALQDIEEDPEAAVQEYEKLVADYPDSRQAAEAKQAIGLIYYGIKAEEAKKPRAKWEQPAKRLPVSATYRPPGASFAAWLVEPLRAALKQQGGDYTSAFLLGVSGCAFQFFYSAQDRQAGWAVFPENPIIVTCETLGFACSSIASEDPDAGYMRLRQSIIEGTPVITEYNLPPRQWLLVTGFDDEQEQVYILPGGASSARAVALADFQGRWSTAGGAGLPSPAPFAQFAVGKRVKSVDAAATARTCLRRAAAHLRGQPVFGIPGGFAAYEALLRDLREHAAELEAIPEDAADLAAWGQRPLEGLRANRRSAAAFLPEIATRLPEAAREPLSRAAPLLKEVESLLGRLKEVFPKAPPERVAEGEESVTAAAFAAQCQSAAELVQQILEREQAAERQIAAAGE